MKLIILAAVLMLAAAPINAQETPEAAAAPSAASQQEATDAAASVIQVGDNPDRIIRVRTRVRHTTVIQLPGRENILDFVVPSIVKTVSEGVNTNVALALRIRAPIYSFLSPSSPANRI